MSMGLCLSGLNAKITATSVEIIVGEEHPYIRLANTLDWTEIGELVMDDLKKTTPKFLWWVGRKLKLRIHLGVYILQSFLKMTDRAIEEAIKGNGIYQVFCGQSVVENWHCPDHTKIEKFRNRISPQTQQCLVSYVAKVAQKMGFADASKMDVDSTVQEANMAYPSDAHLLTKLAQMSKKVTDYIIENTEKFSKDVVKIKVDFKTVKKKAKDYFFMSKNTSKEIKHAAFEQLYNVVKEQVNTSIEMCSSMEWEQIKNLPWNIRRTVVQIRKHAQKYLEDVTHFIKTQTMKSGKILSFHLMDVACIIKGKVGKEKEFGRVFQLGRLGGNFFIVLPSTTVRQEDKPSLQLIVKEHEKVFGKNVLNSLATDKGYYWKENIKALQNKIPELAIQIPGHVKAQTTISQELKDRRAGIEPLIGHIKKFGLGKSNAKSDQTTLASGYRSVLGFNLHQMVRCLSK